MGGMPTYIMFDGGKEFVNDMFQDECRRRGWYILVGGWYTPEHQGIVERHNWV